MYDMDCRGNKPPRNDETVSVITPSPVIANEVKQSGLRHVDTCMIWIAAAINRLAMTRLYFVGDNGVPLCQKQNRLAMTKPPEKGALLLRSQ